MNISIKTHHVELTPELRAYVEEKVSKLEKFTRRNSDGALIDVELGMETAGRQSGNLHRAEIQVSLPQYNPFTVEAQHEDLHAAIDEVQEEALREVKKMRGRRESLFMRGARKFKDLTRTSS